MSETSKVQPDPNGEPSPNEKRYNWLVEGVRKIRKRCSICLECNRPAGGLANGQIHPAQIAPEATVKSGNTDV